ncbi:hypothetical protein HanPSC8_Chr06g0231621 [Helianthus annuus]|nr:hypothetical protein HanPSC8_Chr06g0231621 [Helianthus annuus]
MLPFVFTPKRNTKPLSQNKHKLPIRVTSFQIIKTLHFNLHQSE